MHLEMERMQDGGLLIYTCSIKNVASAESEELIREF